MKNPKSFRNPNGVTKRTKSRNNQRAPILFENIFENNSIDAGVNHLQFQDWGIIFCNACQTDVSFENSNRHCVGKKHQGKCKILTNKKVQAYQTLVTLKLFKGENPDIQGQSLSDKTKSIRHEFVNLISDCKISSKKGKLIKEFFHVHSESVANIGHLRKTQDYFKHVHTALISQKKKYFLKQGRDFVILADPT